MQRVVGTSLAFQTAYHNFKSCFSIETEKTEIFIAIALLKFKASWLLLCVGHPFTPRHMIVISGFPDRKPDEYHRVNLLE